MSVGMVGNVQSDSVRYDDRVVIKDKSVDQEELQSRMNAQEEKQKTPSKEATESYSAPEDFMYAKSPAERTRVNDAIRDMKRDHVLQRYQYFVSSANRIVSRSEDGVVIKK